MGQEPNEISSEFEADSKHAQILIGLGESLQRFDEVRDIIESTGVEILSVDYPSPGKVRFKLNVSDMRVIVLRLIEAGFSTIKGINAGKF